MKALRTSLFARLALVFLVIMALLGGSLLLVSSYMSDYHSQDLLQHLNQPVAGYVTEQRQLIDLQGAVDETALDELASHAMILNPALEIYLLDPNGQILSHRLPGNQVQQTRVDLNPIRQYLQPNRGCGQRRARHSQCGCPTHQTWSTCAQASAALRAECNGATGDQCE